MQGLALVLGSVLVAATLSGCVATPESLAAAALATCADHSAAQQTSTEFNYAGAVACKSGTEEYEWANPMVFAGIAWAGAVLDGEITVTIKDSMRRTVGTYKMSGSSAEGEQARTDPGFPSLPGVTSWTISLKFEDFTGTMGLTIRNQQGAWTETTPDGPANGLHTLLAVHP